MGALNGTKILMVIASKAFRDEEYLKPRALFEKEGAKVTVACSKMGAAKGMLGAVVKPDLLLSDAKAADYDAVLFVGGMGSTEYWDSPVAHKLAKDFAAAEKPTTAICLAPVTLARAGLLKGRSATVWPDAVKDMKAQGAVMKAEAVVIDGNFITSDGPQSAEAFGKAVIAALAKKQRV